MLVYLGSRERLRVLVLLCVAFLALGAKLALSLSRSIEQPAVRIDPITGFGTNQPLVAVVVSVTDARTEHIAACLELLNSCQVKATWFASATWIEANLETVRQIAANGHELGLSSTDTRTMDRLPERDIRERLMRCRQALNKAEVEPVPFFLPPGIKTSERLNGVIFQEACQVIMPGLDGRTMRGNPDQAASRLAASAKPGDVLLLEVSRRGIAPQPDYVYKLVQSLKEHGLSLAKVSDVARTLK